MTTPWGLPDFDAHEALALRPRRGLRPAGDHRHPLDPSRPRRGRRALLALCRRRRRADRRAAAVARHELQERHGRPAAGRRQVGHPGRRGADQDAGAAGGVRARRERPGRALRDRRGCRHERHRHDRGQPRRPNSSPGSRPKAAVGGDPGPAHLARRVPRHQGGGRSARSARTACRPAHRAAGRGQRRHRRRAARRGRRREAVDRRRRRGQGAGSSPTPPAGTVVAPDDILALEADVLSPNALGAILDEQTHPDAPRADRRRRRQQPARDARGRRAAARTRHPLRARLCDQRRRHHQRLHRISRRRRREPGARADRGHSRAARADLGRKRSRPAAIRPRSPTPWRSG